MAKKKKKTKCAPVVVLRKKDIQEVLLKELTSSALRVYLLMCCNHNGYNNGEIKLTFDETQKKEITGLTKKQTFYRAIKELEDKGLIETIHKGGLYKRASKYRMLEGRLRVY